jgi:hypothetical protein
LISDGQMICFPPATVGPLAARTVLVGSRNAHGAHGIADAALLANGGLDLVR